MSWAIVVHGGAGAWSSADREAALTGVAAAARTGADVLRGGGSALDAAAAAVVALEDDPLFNAGTGSVLNLDGEVEMDACIMAGADLACGAVAAIRRVRNPIRVARRVMEATPHVMLAGEGALRFARGEGFADWDPITPRARSAWQRSGAPGSPGTVGAVALDCSGCLAAATSTGGVLRKLPGRVGDSPVPGAGTYATRAAACSATGRGELMLRVLAAKTLCDRVASGEEPQTAVERLLDEMQATVGADAGLILLSQDGRIGISHRTPAMPHAWQTAHEPLSACMAGS